MNIDICICTHNPRLEILRSVIVSIAQQKANPDVISVLLIDNDSKPALEKDLLAPIAERGIVCRIVHEPNLGLSRARIRAIQETLGEWILFVDDDNELNSDFIEQGLAFIQLHPDVGCFGGRLLLPSILQPANWVKPFLPYLGIKDEGDMEIIGNGDQWGPWEPPGAGAWVHRKVLNEYLHRSQKDERLFKLGRTGTGNLASCDDSIMMRGSLHVGLKNAYVPDLMLMHHLDPKRFHFRYLMRLMRAFGISHIVLETVLSGPQSIREYYKSNIAFLNLLLSTLKAERNKPLQYIIGMFIYHFAARREYYSQQSEINVTTIDHDGMVRKE
jgi:glycosyltransferase involved in cell wall biosynthesis